MIEGATALSDPRGGSALAEAGLWVQHLLLGTVATVVATLAIATIGYLMMAGRVSVRRGATVIVGCFVLFGAPVIAAGILGAAAADQQDTVLPVPAASGPLPAPSPAPGTVKPAYDPYAGASVPTR